MAYVIAEPCVALCDTACTKVCPVECIHGPLSPREIAALSAEERPSRLAGLQLYIDPEECICCAACVEVCPVGAIFEEEELPPELRHYRERNARFFQAPSREGGV